MRKCVVDSIYLNNRANTYTFINEPNYISYKKNLKQRTNECSCEKAKFLMVVVYVQCIRRGGVTFVGVPV